jgi:hypothetical protein
MLLSGVLLVVVVWLIQQHVHVIRHWQVTLQQANVRHSTPQHTSARAVCSM